MNKIPKNRLIKDVTKKQNPFLKLKKTRVCAYVRVSTDSAGQLSSLENQTQYYQKVLQTNPDYEFCGIFSDAGISGLKIDRPGLQAMMDKARNAELDLIITKSISRFARNTLMLLQYVRELKQAGVGILFEEQNINTQNAEGELMLTVLAAIVEEERKSVCSNVRWAIQNKFKRGEMLFHIHRLLGFDKDADGNTIINEEQADIVRRIYKLYLNRVSGYKIAQMLNDEKILTFTDHPWSSDRIMRIMANEKHVGDCLLQKAYVNEAGRNVINRGERPKYYVKDAHPAIVSRADWLKAQDIRAGRKKTVYPLTGLIRCPYCGASLIHVIHVVFI